MNFKLLRMVVPCLVYVSAEPASLAATVREKAKITVNRNVLRCQLRMVHVTQMQYPRHRWGNSPSHHVRRPARLSDWFPRADAGIHIGNLGVEFRHGSKGLCDSLNRTLALCKSFPSPSVPRPVQESLRKTVQAALYERDSD